MSGIQIRMARFSNRSLNFKIICSVAGNKNYLIFFSIGQNYEVIAEFDPFNSNQVVMNPVQQVVMNPVEQVVMNPVQQVGMNPDQSNSSKSTPLQLNQVQSQSNPVEVDPVNTTPVQPSQSNTELLQANPVQVNPANPVELNPPNPIQIRATPIGNLLSKSNPLKPNPVQSNIPQSDPVPAKSSALATNPSPGKSTPTCHICHKKYKSNAHLYVHLREVHRPPTEKGPICKICNMETRGTGALRAHMMKVHGLVVPVSERRRTKIPDEDILLIDPEELENLEMDEPQHDLCSAYKLTPECGICWSTFEDRTSLREHLKEFHGLANETNLYYQPEKIRKKYQMRFPRKNSKKIKGKVQDSEDSDVDVEYDDDGREAEFEAPRPSLRKSVYYFNKHKRNFRSKCTICNIRFADKHSRTWHMLRVHTERDSRLVIPILKPEMRQEAPILEDDGDTTRLKHACHVCRQTFRFASSLKRHLKWEHNETYVPPPNTRTDGSGRCVIHHLSGKRVNKPHKLSEIRIINSATGKRPGKRKQKGVKVQAKTHTIKKAVKANAMTTIYNSSPNKRIRLASDEVVDPLAELDFKYEIDNDHDYFAHDIMTTYTSECTACYETLYDDFDLKSHWEREHNLKELSVVIDKYNPKSSKPLCTICGVTLAHSYSLQRHLKHVHGRDMLNEVEMEVEVAPVVECTICQMTFKFEASLKRHMKWVHDVQAVAIVEEEEAIKTFASENVECILGDKPTCSLCATAFKETYLLKRHLIRVHHLEESAADKIVYPDQVNSKDKTPRPMCSMCQTSFSQLAALRRHLKIIHNFNLKKIGRFLKKEMQTGKNVEIESTCDTPTKEQSTSQGNETLCCPTEDEVLKTAEPVSNNTTHETTEQSVETETTCDMLTKEQSTSQGNESLSPIEDEVLKTAETVSHNTSHETVNPSIENCSKLKPCETVNPTDDHCSKLKPDQLKPRCNLCNITYRDSNKLTGHLQRMHGIDNITNECIIPHTKQNRINDESLSKQKKLQPSCTICKVTFTKVQLLQTHLEKAHGLEIIAIPKDPLQEDLFNDKELIPCIKVEVVDNQVEPDITEEEKHAVRCPICLKHMLKSSSMKRHLLKIHNLDEDYANDLYARENLQEQYTRYYKYRKELKAPTKITQVIVDSEALQPTCTMCHKSFAVYSGLKTHLKIVHNFDAAALENYFKLANLVLQTTCKVVEITDPEAGHQNDFPDKDDNFFENNDGFDPKVDDDLIEPSETVAEEATDDDEFDDDFNDPDFQANDKENESNHEESDHPEPKKRSPQKIKIKRKRRTQPASKPKPVRKPKPKTQDQEDSATKNVCSLCKTTFSKRFNLRKHLASVHKIDKIYKCGVCKKDVFGDTASHCLSKHPDTLTRIEMEVPSNRKIYACPECGKICHEDYHLKRHILRMHKPADPQTCEFCGKSFKSKEYLNKHINIVHVKEPTHKCDQCDQSFLYANILRQHKEQVHLKIRWTCDQCDSSYSTITSLKNHVALAHLKLKSFTCSICAKELKSKMSLDRHVATAHDGANKLQCSWCEQIFPDSEALENHKKIDHTKFPCTQCDKSFVSGDVLTRHVTNKHDPKSNSCPLCDAGFLDNNLLKGHMRSAHGKDKSYTCDECQRSFSESHALKRHVRIVHLKEKRHVCEHCGKGFAIPFILRQHIQSAHLKERKFECDVCGDAFTASHVLKKHKNRHAKEMEEVTD